MKKLIALTALLVSVSLSGCVPSSPQRGIGSPSNSSSMSVEAEARQRTQKMSELLGLTATQKDDVMVTNIAHLKLVKNLRSNNETSKISSANDSYKNKLKSILSATQYATFMKEMGDM